MNLLTPFLIGFLGSWHCVGMCGAISLALPVSKIDRWKMASDMLIYNLGRITTYSFIGLLTGFMGRAIFFYGYQEKLSLTLGIIIIAVMIVSYIKPVKDFFYVEKFYALMNQLMSYFFKKSGVGAYFGIGIVNGFLPCGLVYLAATTALVTDSVKLSVLAMFLFGLGTLPLMMLFSTGSRFLKQKIKVNAYIPYFTALVAILLIIRGLSLGIPYISPEISNIICK